MTKKNNNKNNISSLISGLGNLGKGGGKKKSGGNSSGSSSSFRSNSGSKIPRDSVSSNMSDDTALNVAITNEARSSVSSVDLDQCSVKAVTCRMMCDMSAAKRLDKLGGPGSAKIKKWLIASEDVRESSGFYNLTGIKWKHTDVFMYNEAEGKTLYDLCNWSYERTVTVDNLVAETDEARKSSYRIDLTKSLNLSDLPDESSVQVLASCFSVTRESYLERDYQRILDAGTLEDSVYTELKKVYTIQEKIKKLKQMNILHECSSFQSMDGVTLCELLEHAVSVYKTSLENRIESIVSSGKLNEERKVINALAFNWSIGGTGSFQSIVGSSKIYSTYFETEGASCRLLMKLTSTNSRPTKKSGVTDLRLQLYCEVNLLQDKIVDLFNKMGKSMGVMTLPMSEIAVIQDAAWSLNLESEILNEMDKSLDYRLANVTDLIPLMVMAGVRPTSMEDEMIRKAWFACVDAMMDKLCKLSSSFGTADARAHFVRCLNVAMILSIDVSDYEEAARFAIQFMLWGKVTTKDDGTSLTGYSRYNWEAKQKAKLVTGIGSQVMWTACCLLDENSVTSIGYKYLADIMVYNVFISGKAEIKLLSMGFWLAGAMNSRTNLVDEDEKLISRANALGMRMTSSEKEAIKATCYIPGKIAALVQCAADYLSRLSKEKAYKGLSADESVALLLGLKCQIFEDCDEDRMLKRVSDISCKVIDRLENCKMQGEIEPKAAESMAINLAKCLEMAVRVDALCKSDDSECKKYANAVVKMAMMANARDLALMRDILSSAEAMEKEEESARREREVAVVARQDNAFFDAASKVMPTLMNADDGYKSGGLGQGTKLVTTKQLYVDNVDGTEVSLTGTEFRAKDVAGLALTMNAGAAQVGSVKLAHAAEIVGPSCSTIGTMMSITILDGFTLDAAAGSKIDLDKISRCIRMMSYERSKSSALAFGSSKSYVLKVTDKPGQDPEVERTLQSRREPMTMERLKQYFKTMAEEYATLTEVNYSDGEPIKGGARVLVCVMSSPTIIMCASIITVRRMLDLVWDTASSLLVYLTTMENSIKDNNKWGRMSVPSITRMAVMTTRLSWQASLISYRLNVEVAHSIVFEIALKLKTLNVKASTKLIEGASELCRMFKALGTGAQADSSDAAGVPKIRGSVYRLNKRVAEGNSSFVDKIMSATFKGGFFVVSGFIKLAMGIARSISYVLKASFNGVYWATVSTARVSLKSIKIIARATKINVVASLAKDKISKLAAASKDFKKAMLARIKVNKTKDSEEVADRLLEREVDGEELNSAVAEQKAKDINVQGADLSPTGKELIPIEVSGPSADSTSEKVDVSKLKSIMDSKRKKSYVPPQARGCFNEEEAAERQINANKKQLNKELFESYTEVEIKKEDVASIELEINEALVKKDVVTIADVLSDDDSDRAETESAVVSVVTTSSSESSDIAFSRRKMSDSGRRCSYNNPVYSPESKVERQLKLKRRSYGQTLKLASDWLKETGRSLKKGFKSSAESIKKACLRSMNLWIFKSAESSLRRIIADAKKKSKIEAVPTGAILSKGVAQSTADLVKAQAVKSIKQMTDDNNEKTSRDLVLGSRLDQDSSSCDKLVRDIDDSTSHDQRERLVADVWDYLSNDLQLQTSKCCDPTENLNVEMLSKDKLVVHKNNEPSKVEKLIAAKGMIIVDLDECTVLNLPLPGNFVLGLEAMSTDQENLNKLEWSTDCVSNFRCTTARNGFMYYNGFGTVVKNDKTGAEIAITPQHLWRYGKDLLNYNSVDRIICIAVCECTSSITMSTEDEANFVDAKTPERRCIEGKKFFKGFSDRYIVASTELKNWKGCSGLPVINSKGNLMGVCVMQIMVNNKVEVMKGSGLIIVCRDLTQGKLVVATSSLKISKCDRCFKVDKTKDDASSSGDKGAAEGQASSTPESDKEISQKEVGGGATTSKPSKGLFRRSMDFFNWRMNDNGEQTVVATMTGAMEEACKVLVSKNLDKFSMSGGDKDTVASMKEILFFSRSRNASELTTIMLKEVLRAFIEKRCVWIVCFEQHLLIAFASLLSAIRCRFSLVRDYYGYSFRVRSGYTSKTDNVCLVSAEDMLIWAAEDRFSKAKPMDCNEKMLLFRPDGQKEGELSASCMRLAMINFKRITVMTYDGTVADTMKFVDSNQRSGNMIKTARVPAMQNSGFFVTFYIDSSMSVYSKAGDYADESKMMKISAYVISSCTSANALDKVRKRAASYLGYHESAVMAGNVSSLASEGVWEIVRGCSVVIFDSCLAADCSKKIIANATFARSPSKYVVDSLVDAIKICAIARGEADIANSMTIGKMVHASKVVLNEGGQFIVEVAVKKQGDTTTTPAFMTIRDLTKKIDNVLIEGKTLRGNKLSFSEVFKEMAAKDSVKVSEIPDSEVVNADLVASKEVKKSVFKTIRESLAALRSKITWTVFKIKLQAEILVDAVVAKITKWMQTAKAKATAILENLSLKSREVMRKLKERAAGMAKKTISGEASVVTTARFIDDEERVDAPFMNVVRTVGAAVLAGSIRRIGNKTLSLSARKDNAIIAGVAWSIIEAMISRSTSATSKVIRAVGSLVSVIAATITTAGVLGSKARTLTVGRPERMGSLEINAEATLSIVADVAEGVSKCVSYVNDEVTVVMTAEIIRDVNKMSPIYLFSMIADLVTNAAFAMYKIIYNSRLANVMSTLWDSIRSRTEGNKNQLQTIKAVPCFEYLEAGVGGLLIAAGAVASYRYASARAEISAASVGVLADKKHTADVLEVYRKDRSLYSTLSRWATFCTSLACFVNYTANSIYVGVGSLILLGLDLILENENDVGVSYRLSHILVRTYWSNNKALAMMNGAASWWSKPGVSGCGMNALIITAESKLMSKDQSRKLAARFKDEAIKEQAKEDSANNVLMDMSVEPREAYIRCKKVILGSKVKKGNDFTDAGIWDINDKAGDEEINLSLVARGGLGRINWDEEDVICEMRSLTKNQCRYLGRTGKLVWRRDQLIADSYEQAQFSMLFLDERLWEGVILEENRDEYQAAGDSRYAVLFALAERNDVPARFDIDDKVIEIAAQEAVRLLGSLVENKMRVRPKVLGMDWWSIACAANDKSTSGIIARKRSGQKLTAGYLAFYADRCELAKEMLIDESSNGEINVINVFAKRRIEKKKISSLTGEKCVITRTIQANETEAKSSVVEAYLLEDKIMKVKRCNSSLAIALNFFVEFSEDDLNIIVGSCEKKRTEKQRIVRVSLDHSSFDGSQRNWSIRMTQEIRKCMGDEMIKEKSLKKKFRNYLDKCYDQLKVRVMLTTAGDLFALTGQQMSGHATTSSDNSMKSFIYARSCVRIMSNRLGASIVEGSLRVQGDDTKFDMSLEHVASENAVKAEISRAMAKIGQNVKEEKIIITETYEGCDFLSHCTAVRVFEVRRGGRTWMEAHVIPLRRVADIFSMAATTLKAKKGESTKKTKRDVSLLAAKAMSFMMMYATDYVVAYLTNTIIWACFKILTAMKHVGSRVDIKESWLPWLVSQSDITGDFEVDVNRVMEMHGINRNEFGVKAVNWVINADQETTTWMKRIETLQRNFERCFDQVKNWEWSSFKASFDLAPTEEEGIAIASIEAAAYQMSEISKSLNLRVTGKEVNYEPYLALKRRVTSRMEQDTRSYSNKFDKVYVTEGIDRRDVEGCLRAICEFEGREVFEKCERSLHTSDGIIIENITVHILPKRKPTDDLIAIVDTIEEARMLDCKAWKIYEMVQMGNTKLERELVDRLESKRLVTAKDGRMIDERMTRRIESLDDQIKFTTGRLNDDLVVRQFGDRMKFAKTNYSTYKKIILVSNAIIKK